MVPPVPQRVKSVRGEAFEELVVNELEARGCSIAKRFRPLEKEGKDKPDLYAYCEDKLVRIEIKETLAFHKEGDKERPGRFILSKVPSFKECYAFGVDNQKTGTLMIDFIKAEKPDDYSKHQAGDYPKYPIKELEKIRDTDRCFEDVSTIILPRHRLEELMK